MKEIWRLIPSLPEYIASSKGNVMRLPYTGQMPHGGERQYGGEVVAGVTHNQNQMRPTLRFRRKNYRVSRLVCEAFHGRAPSAKAVVMHLNDDATDNRPQNLKWGTQKENLNALSFINYCKSITGEMNPLIKGRKKLSELTP